MCIFEKKVFCYLSSIKLLSNTNYKVKTALSVKYKKEYKKTDLKESYYSRCFNFDNVINLTWNWYLYFFFENAKLLTWTNKKYKIKFSQTKWKNLH